MTDTDISTEINACCEAVDVLNPDGMGPVVILCEHASAFIPPRYYGLGLRSHDLLSHAAWDKGAMNVALRLSVALDAPLISSKISRLVYDCNRPPDAEDAMPTRSERIDIPGNIGLSIAQQEDRIERVYTPFRAATNAVIAQRLVAGKPTALITMHSFTPVYFDRNRPTEIGILHDSDSRFADLILEQSSLLPTRRIDRNSPYGPQDGVTHSLKEYGIANAIPNVMIEIRNDLLTSEGDERSMSAELLALLGPALLELRARGQDA